MRLLLIALCCVPLFVSTVCQAQEKDPSGMFLEYVRRQAAQLRAQAKPPKTLDEWNRRRSALREKLQEAWGAFPKSPCPLEPRVIGSLVRDGYRVEKIVLRTRPGVWMTANAYVPDQAKSEKVPAVLCVHGHWKGAKQDPVVQARCLGLVKLGFFVLVVDAFGAGERALGKELGEYHGEMVAATLFPVGLPLCGLQVYENGRAVDYLRTRPEVDPNRIGITGASGGGNQTMYAGAWDDRFAAVVPVCSVGNYQAYLGAACCMCEVVPGALRFTEEDSVLGLTAPRALMVINATKDAVQFSVSEASKSLEKARAVFALYDRPQNLKHATFESPHDYNQAMREAMYGWMTLHLRGQGDGIPIREPAFKTENPEDLRCFPGSSRPDNYVTIPRFAAAEARKILAGRKTPASAVQWKAERETMLRGLVKSLGGDPPAASQKPLVKVVAGIDDRTVTFVPEPGLALTARQQPANARAGRLALVLDLEGREKADANPWTDALRRKGWSVVTLDLRATGKLAVPHDGIGRAPDHNSAEWALWLGRPLVGQWVCDVRCCLDVLAQQDGALPKQVLVAGIGPAGLVAICAGALDSRITTVATSGTLASYVTEEPYEGQRLGILVPGILSHVGDVAHLAALVSPRRLLIAGGVTGSGRPLDSAAMSENYVFTSRVYDLQGAASQFEALPSVGADKAMEDRL